MEYDSRDKYGRYLDEFQKGDIYRHWPGKTMTEGDHALFCAITNNTSPLHCDANFMKNHQYGKILVAGQYILSLVSAMSVPDTSGKCLASLGYESITHDAPVFIGDTIHAETEVIEIKKSNTRRDRGVVRVETRAFNQKGEKVITLRRSFLVSQKPST